MRRSIVLAGYTVMLVCSGRGATDAQTSERLVLDSGTTVRVRPEGKPAIEGYLLASYAPENDSLRMCVAGKGGRCADSTAKDIRRFAARELESVAIRGPQTFNLGLLGLYAGGLAGAVLAHGRTTDTGDFMGLGIVAGALLGGSVGKHVEGWIPLFPCPVHGQCAWPATASPRYRGVR